MIAAGSASAAAAVAGVVSEVMAQRLSEAAAGINPEQIATQLFTRAKTFFLDLKAKIAWVLNIDDDDNDKD